MPNGWKKNVQGCSHQACRGGASKKDNTTAYDRAWSVVKKNARRAVRHAQVIVNDVVVGGKIHRSPGVYHHWW